MDLLLSAQSIQQKHVHDIVRNVVLQICALYVSLGKHKRHKTMHISKMADDRKEPRNTDLQTGAKFTRFKMALEIIIPFICITFSDFVVRFFLIVLVVPGPKIHLWLIVILLHVILTILLQDLMFFCLKHVCDLDFALSHFFEYLKCLMTRTKEPKKFNVKTATKVTLLENVLKMIICFICLCIIGFVVIFTLIIFVDPGGKIHLWLIVAVLNAILLLCFPVYVHEFTGFSSLFEFQIWLMTRTEELWKYDLQTTTNELSGEGIIANFFSM